MLNTSIFCGQHKTGTTSTQKVCATNRSVLLANGVFYPPSGAHDGHHNLAWELTGDPRFDPAGITWKSTLRQIAGFPGNSVISSEDFESILHRPEVFSPIVEALQAAGREVRVVIYVRDRARYIESLYLELLKHRFPRTFDEYHDEINRTGFLVFRSWVYQFDLLRVETTLRTIPGLKIAMRHYNESPKVNIVADFFSTIGLSPDTLADAAQTRLNKRPSVAGSLYMFLSNRLVRNLTIAECDVITKLTLQKSFAWSIGQPRGHAASGHYLGRVFSNRTVDAICSLANARMNNSGLERLSAWWEGRTPAATFVAFQLPAKLSRQPSFQLISVPD